MDRILIVANTFSVSVVFRYSLLKKLIAADKLQGVVSLTRDYESLLKSVDFQFYPRPLQSFAFIWYRLMKDPSTIVIHSFTHPANLAVTISSVLFRKKAILTITGMGRGFNKSGIYGFSLRNLIRLFYFFSQFFVEAIIVQNSDDFQEIRRLLVSNFRNKLFHTNGSGVPLDYYQNCEPEKLNGGKIVIGFFSRALMQKGVSSFYRLAKQFQDRSDLEFLHVGLPGEGAFNSINIANSARASNVRYNGAVRDLRSWLLAVDIVLIPSDYREGLSRLFIEAMLAGKVVIVKDTTGVRDHVQNGVNAFIYRFDHELAQVFLSAIDAVDTSVGSSANGYARQHFDVNEVDSVYLEIYRRAGISI